MEKKIRRISKDTGKSINLVIQEIIYQDTGFKCGIDEIIGIIVKSESLPVEQHEAQQNQCHAGQMKGL